MRQTYTIDGARAGSEVSVAEVNDRSEVVLTIRDGASVSAIHLNQAQFEELCGLKYKVDLKAPRIPEPPAPPAPLDIKEGQF